MTEIEKIEPGTRLGRYECLHPIGKGGMGAVWAAQVVGDESDKIVAVKTVLPQHADNPDYVDMLLDEGRILSGIRHPNVASLLDMGSQDGAFYLAFEWVEGEQLSQLRGALKKKQLVMPVGIALRIVAEVCGGLHSAHEVTDAEGRSQRIVHRDVSPQNIMVASSGEVKLIDFGIAKALDRIADETVAGMVKGKVLYMSPEQVTGESLDRRVDVWAAGAVLYHLVSGRTPFGTNQPLKLMDCLATRSEPDPLPADLHPAVSRAILRALRPVREERYPTAADFQRDLEQAASQSVGSVTREDLAVFVREHVGAAVDARCAAIASARAALRAKSPGKAVVPAPGEPAPRGSAPHVPMRPDAKVGTLSSPGDAVRNVPAPRVPRPSDPKLPASPPPKSAPGVSARHAPEAPFPTPDSSRMSEPDLEPVDFPVTDTEADEFDMPSLEEPMFTLPPGPEPSPDALPDIPSPDALPDIPSPDALPDIPSPDALPDIPLPEVQARPQLSESPRRNRRSYVVAGGVAGVIFLIVGAVVIARTETPEAPADAPALVTGTASHQPPEQSDPVAVPSAPMHEASPLDVVHEEPDAEARDAAPVAAASATAPKIKPFKPLPMNPPPPKDRSFDPSGI